MVYIVQEFLAKNKMAVVPNPPDLPDLAPSDFPQDVNQVEGPRFDTGEEIHAEMQTVLNILTKKYF
jgi:hypothetical protein